VPRFSGEAGPGVPATTVAGTMSETWMMSSAGTPPPAASIDEAPVAVVEGRPSPGVAGDKGPTKAGIVAPGSIAVGVPFGTDAIGLPGYSVAGNVTVLSVVGKIGGSGGVGIFA